MIIVRNCKKEQRTTTKALSDEMERISQRIQKSFPDKVADKEVLYESEAKIPRIEELNAESNAGYVVYNIDYLFSRTDLDAQVTHNILIH